MRYGVIGGLFVGGLLADALFGLGPGTILIGIGAVIAALGVAKDAKQAEAEQSWRKSYPTYKY